MKHFHSVLARFLQRFCVASVLTVLVAVLSQIATSASASTSVHPPCSASQKTVRIQKSIDLHHIAAAPYVRPIVATTHCLQNSNKIFSQLAMLRPFNTEYFAVSALENSIVYRGVEVENVKIQSVAAVQVLASHYLQEMCGAEMSYPVSVTMSGGTTSQISNGQLHLLLHWDASIFEPLSVDAGRIVRNSISEGIRSIELEMNSLVWTNESSATFYIQGRSLLTNKESTVVAIDKVWWSGTSSSVISSKLNGSIMMRQHCFPSTIELTGPTSTGCDLIPHPAMEKCIARIVASEEGLFTIAVSDLLGNEQMTTSHFLKFNQQAEIPLDVQRLVPGSYVLIVQAPTHVVTRLFRRAS